jgi:hypothetical protein
MEHSADEAREKLLAPDVATTRATDTDSDAVAVVGYLGKGECDQYRHLYRDLDFKVFLRIPVADIVDRRSETEGDLTQGRSVVWVKSDAVLLLCETVRVQGRSGPGPTAFGGHPWPWPFGR